MPLILKSLVAFAIALSSVSSQTTVIQVPMVFGTSIGDSTVNTFSDADRITPGVKATAVWIHGTNPIDGFGISFPHKGNFIGREDGPYPPVFLHVDEYISGFTCALDKFGIHYLEFRITNKKGKTHRVPAGVEPKTLLAGMKQDAPKGAHVPYQLAGFYGGIRDGKIVHMAPIWTMLRY